MDYSKKLTALIEEILDSYNNDVEWGCLKYLIFIPLAPIIIIILLFILNYYIIAFVVKAISSPCDTVHNFIKEERKEVGKPAEAVIYLVAMPFIILYQIFLSVFSFVFFILWFIIMSLSFVATVGNIRWQPFIADAVFETAEQSKKTIQKKESKTKIDNAPDTEEKNPPKKNSTKYLFKTPLRLRKTLQKKSIEPIEFRCSCCDKIIDKKICPHCGTVHHK